MVLVVLVVARVVEHCHRALARGILEGECGGFVPHLDESVVHDVDLGSLYVRFELVGRNSLNLNHTTLRLDGVEEVFHEHELHEAVVHRVNLLAQRSHIVRCLVHA